MKQNLPSLLEAGRVRTGRMASTAAFGMTGAFRIQGPGGAWLNIIATDGAGGLGELADWEHVSVHADKHGKKSTPNWNQMCFVKDIFWMPEECVIQYHPPQSEYVNNHEFVLHLWKWKRDAFPVPPSIAVGIKIKREVPA